MSLRDPKLTKEQIANEECCVCKKPATMYCMFCADEYETGPAVPICFFCEEHEKSVYLTGNCCYGNEKVYGRYRG